ncbi:MAG: hypothetical protein AAGI07_11500, partial [Bacteroidota bacterium]
FINFIASYKVAPLLRNEWHSPSEIANGTEFIDLGGLDASMNYPNDSEEELIENINDFMNYHNKHKTELDCFNEKR